MPLPPPQCGEALSEVAPANHCQAVLAATAQPPPLTLGTDGAYTQDRRLQLCLLRTFFAPLSDENAV